MSLVALVLLTFWPATLCDFVVYDDPQYVVANPHVRNGLTLVNMTWAFSTLHGGISYWHPLAWLSHQLDCQLFGLWPGGHHLTSIWLHVANTALIFSVFKALGLGPQPAFLTAGFFGVHPLHVESVAWIAERKDVLYTIFWLIALLSYVRFRRGGGWKRYSFSLIAFASALMSKPTAVTLPLVLTLLELTLDLPNRPDRKEWWKRWFLISPYVLMAAVIVGVTCVGQSQIGALRVNFDVPWSRLVIQAAFGYAVYLSQFLWPQDLCVSYVQSTPPPGLDLAGAGCLLIIITVISFGLRTIHRWSWIGWLWFVVTLLPNIGLIQVGSQSHADHYMYIPLSGLAVAVFDGLATLASRRRCSRWTDWVAAALLISCALLSQRQLQYWRTSTALFQRAVEHNPMNWVARLSLGMALTQEHKFRQAITQLEEAARLPGNQAEAHQRLGICFQWSGRDLQALHHYQRALEINPHLVEAYFHAAHLLTASANRELQDPDRAVQFARFGLRLSSNPTGQQWLIAGAAYGQAGLRVEAEHALQEASACFISAPDPLWEGYLVKVKAAITESEE